MEKTEATIDQLIGYLQGHGYEAAATYMRRAKIGIFGYIRRWQKWGMISPRAPSMIERGMRELGRRIRKIAYGWSDKGVTKVARIILKRFANASKWEDYWQKRMEIIGNVVIGVGNYKCFHKTWNNNNSSIVRHSLSAEASGLSAAGEASCRSPRAGGSPAGGFSTAVRDSYP